MVLRENFLRGWAPDKIGQPCQDSILDVAKVLQTGMKIFPITNLDPSINTTAKILKSGKILCCFYFANSSPYRDMWLSCLSRATTPHSPRFSKSSW